MQQAISFEIDARTAAIAQAEYDILQLLAQYNEVSATSQLGPKILSEIFMYFAVNPYAYRRNNADPPPDIYKWLTVTHICRSWRTAALASEVLWSYIYPINSHATEAFINRSKKAPVNIILPFHVRTRHEKYWKWFADIHKSLDQRKKLHSMTLVLTEHSLRYSYFRNGFYRSSTLKSFCLTSPSPLGDVLPETIDGDKWPALEHLTLRRYFMPRKGSFFPNTLTSLVLEDKPHPPDFPSSITADPLFNCLNHMSRLERLEISTHSCGKQCNSGRQRGEPWNSLPSLQYLSIRHDIAFMTAFLDHFNLPALSTVKLDTSVIHQHVQSATAYSDGASALVSRVVNLGKPQDPISGISVLFISGSISSGAIRELITYGDRKSVV